MSGLLAALVCAGVVLAVAAVPAAVLVVLRCRRRRWDALVASFVTPESLIRDAPPPLFGTVTRLPSRLPHVAAALELTPHVDDAFAAVTLPRAVVCNVTGAACSTPSTCLARGCRRVAG